MGLLLKPLRLILNVLRLVLYILIYFFGPLYAAIRASLFRKAVRLDSREDREFADVIIAIANRRRVDRSTAITVTPLFQPMLDRLSPTQLKNYIFSRYSNRRGEDQFTKYDLVDIGQQELSSFDLAFVYKDHLSMTFSYSNDWETASGFLAVLLNDQL
jgi:hypothetical protein